MRILLRSQMRQHRITENVAFVNRQRSNNINVLIRSIYLNEGLRDEYCLLIRGERFAKYGRVRCFISASEKEDKASQPSAGITSSSYTNSTIAILDNIIKTGSQASTAIIQNGAKQGELLRHTLSDYLSTIRMKAAQSLASSLPPRDREQVLRAVNAIDSHVAQQETSRSIGEAVAKVRLEEIEKYTKTRGEERAQIMREVEEASTARVMNEIRIQQDRLRKDHMQEVKKNGEITTVTRQEQGRQELEETEKTTTKEEDGGGKEKAFFNLHNNTYTHPILGPVLLDLGYKRIHVVKGSILATIPVWQKQRTYRHDRARAMASDKLKSMHTGLPGIISLHEEKGGKLSILDGQHRVGMLAILENKLLTTVNDDTFKTSQVDLNRILVEVFPEKPTLVSSKAEKSGVVGGGRSTIDHAQDVFTEINKAEPVKLVDMPGVAKSLDRNIITEAASTIQGRYAIMFKTSQRCRSPHINMDNLRDALFTADVVKIHSIRSQASLVAWLEEKNQEMGEKYNSSIECQQNARKTAFAKAVKNEFYLGLDSSWLYQ